jgi:oxygen-dependent protoporphyrinogen oxidase
MGGIDGPPVEAVLYRHARGIPQYERGHCSRLDGIRRDLRKTPGLHLAGNAYAGIGVNDCVRESRALADALLEEAAPAAREAAGAGS